MAGNARLTGTTAAVLLVLLAVEGFTILRIGPLLKWHVFFGMLLVPPVALKIGSTFYRFACFYLKDPDYQKKGLPIPLLRLLGPFVVLLTIVLFGTGIGGLYATGPMLSTLLTLHKLSFIAWFGAMTIHVLGHLVDTARIAPRDFAPGTRSEVTGAAARNSALAMSLVIGLGLAVALLGSVPGFFSHYLAGH